MANCRRFRTAAKPFADPALQLMAAHRAFVNLGGNHDSQGALPAALFYAAANKGRRRDAAPPFAGDKKPAIIPCAYVIVAPVERKRHLAAVGSLEFIAKFPAGAVIDAL